MGYTTICVCPYVWGSRVSACWNFSNLVPWLLENDTDNNSHCSECRATVQWSSSCSAGYDFESFKHSCKYSLTPSPKYQWLFWLLGVRIRYIISLEVLALNTETASDKWNVLTNAWKLLQKLYREEKKPLLIVKEEAIIHLLMFVLIGVVFSFS